MTALPSIAFCRLSLNFDAGLLAADLATLSPDIWVSHFNAGYHDGGWSGVALRSAGGKVETLYADPVAKADYADTEILARCPNIAEALARFQCPIESARLLRLQAGGNIREHRDCGLCVEEGAARLHIPLNTNPDVEFYLDRQRVPMRAGECWYLNFDLPHRVQNLSASDRTHLVLDCVVTPWLRGLIQSAAAVGTGISDRADAGRTSQERLENFCAVVLLDPALQETLRRETEPSRFVALVAEIGEQHGFRFTTEDVLTAMQAGRRSLTARWVVR